MDESVLLHVGQVFSVVKKVCNELIPVHRLPPELLSKIFSLLTFVDQPSCRGPRSSNHSLGWIRVTHVCQRWRSVAHSAASLWAQCVFSLPKGFEDRLALSGEAELKIALNLDIHNLSSLAAHAAFYIPRASSIYSAGQPKSTSLFGPLGNPRKRFETICT
ncbi:hypothetical protein OF83DRAFT_1160568 [Amylostereum chailletii]|nr:hypothetical protein OF83DRAFT_1160568 [Amylostereum chailletii]